MVILASASPRRKQLMKEELFPSFTIITPEIDESLSFKKYKCVRAIVRDIATRKCLKVSQDHLNDLVIAADTVVVINKMIIGKPKDEKDAVRMLKMLSNNIHYVYTAYAINKDGKLVSNIVKTKVRFNKLDDKIINDYVASDSPLDKAGAYGYQDNKDFALVKKIFGSRHNVIGFPTEEIKEDLKKHYSLLKE